MEKVTDTPTKIDPPWKRAMYGFLFLLAVPVALFILGYVSGLLWHIYKWAFSLGD